MIILMLAAQRDIQIEDKEYKHVSLTAWQCWKKYLRWLWVTNQGIPSVFQGGWGVKMI
jgi:hypothetical protein